MPKTKAQGLLDVLDKEVNAQARWLLDVKRMPHEHVQAASFGFRQGWGRCVTILLERGLIQRDMLRKGE